MDIYWAHVAQYKHKVYTRPTAPWSSTSSTRRPWPRRPMRFPLFHAKDGKINPATATATTWCRSARATSTTRRSSSAAAPGLPQPDVGAGHRSRRQREPQPVAELAKVGYDGMAALRG